MAGRAPRPRRRTWRGVPLGPIISGEILAALGRLHEPGGDTVAAASAQLAAADVAAGAGRDRQEAAAL